MSGPLLYGLCGVALVGAGAFGLFAHRHLLRTVIAFNVVGSGVFLAFGALGGRVPGAGADPVPQAMVITGIVVAVAVTALAVTLVVRLFDATGQPLLDEDRDPDAGDDEH